MASTYGAHLNLRDATTANCEGLFHGSCWQDAEEPGKKDDLKGKVAALRMAASGFSYACCKSMLLGVTATLARTCSSR